MAVLGKHLPSSELPPWAILQNMASGYFLSRALYVAARLGIADLLQKGPKDCNELAQAAGAHALSLRRVLRLLASAGVFTENAEGKFSLTPVGEYLQTGLARNSVLLFTGDMGYRAWGGLLHSVQTGEPAFEHVFGMPTFSYYAEHPEEAACFDETMSDFSAQLAMGLVAVYDFSPFKSVVDLGGGHGALLIGILKANKALRGTLFDLPRLAEEAGNRISRAGLAGRCQIVSGDFFENAPEGSDVYILKSILQDWDDPRCATILRNCHQAMPPQGRLLVIEGVYPALVDQSPLSQGAARNDVNMLVCTGGRQRTEAEFRRLFEEAGFRLNRIIPMQGLSSVIEVVKA
jgi:hypothetical protein